MTCLWHVFFWTLFNIFHVNNWWVLEVPFIKRPSFLAVTFVFLYSAFILRSLCPTSLLFLCVTVIKNALFVPTTYDRCLKRPSHDKQLANMVANCWRQIELVSILANFFVLVNSYLTCEWLANVTCQLSTCFPTVVVSFTHTNLSLQTRVCRL